MNHSVEDLGGSMVRLTLEIAPEKFQEGIRTVYNRNRKSITIPGFRKGHAPLQLVERTYGKDIFYEDALNEVLPDLYKQAVEEEKLEVMSRPSVNVGDIKDNEPIKVTCEVAVKPEVKLGDLDSLTKTKKTVEVTDEDIKDEMDRAARRNSRMVEITDRPAKMGDTLTIDFEGSIDGKPFDGGKGEDHDLKLGSHSFIDTFEDQLVGLNDGDEKTVHVTFPQDYYQKDLAGKAADFAVKVKKIRFEEIPAVDDDFVKDTTSFSTVDEYKEDLKKTLTDRKTKEAEESQRREVVDQLTEASTMDMPKAMVDEQCQELISQYAQSLRYQGMDLNQYLKMSGSTIDQLMEEVRPDAEKSLRENLVLDALAKAENIEITDEDVEKELDDMAKSYNMEKDKLKNLISDSELENMKAEMQSRKALDVLMEKVKEVEPKKEDPKAEASKAEEPKAEEPKEEKKTKRTRKAKKEEAEDTASKE